MRGPAIFWALCLGLLGSGAGRASDAAAPEVVIHLQAELCDQPDLARLIADWLGSNAIRHVTRCHLTPAQSGVPAELTTNIWIGLLEPNRARLTFLPPGDARSLVREVALPRGLDELGREQLVQILLASTLALLETERATTQPAQPAQPPTGTVKLHGALVPETRSARTELIPALEYGFTEDATAVAHGPGLVVELRRSQATLGVGVRAEGQLRFPTRLFRGGLTLIRRSQELTGGLTVSAQVHPRLVWTGAMSAGVAFHHLATTSTEANLIPRRDSMTELPFLRLAVGPEWELGGVLLRPELRAELLLTTMSHLAETESGELRELSHTGRWRTSVTLAIGGGRIGLSGEPAAP